MVDIVTESSTPGLPLQKKVTEPISIPESSDSVPVSGFAQAFRDVLRQLTDEELSSTGVQKLLLGMREENEEECEHLRIYIERYYEADKNVAVLTEKVKTQTAIDIFFGVGVGLGGVIIGLSPWFGNIGTSYGIIAAIVGLILIYGATVGRLAKK